jgi:hypothetical protein
MLASCDDDSPFVARDGGETLIDRLPLLLVLRLSNRRGYTSSRPRKSDRNRATFASGEDLCSTGSEIWSMRLMSCAQRREAAQSALFVSAFKPVYVPVRLAVSGKLVKCVRPIREQ